MIEDAETVMQPLLARCWTPYGKLYCKNDGTGLFLGHIIIATLHCAGKLKPFHPLQKTLDCFGAFTISLLQILNISLPS